MTRRKWMQKGYFRNAVRNFKLGLRKRITKVFSLTLFNAISICILYAVVGATFVISIGMNVPFLFDTAAWAETFSNVIKGIPRKPFTQLPALAVSAAALIALITYRRGKQQATSKFFFEQSCQGLDEVYNLLKGKKNDRVIWVRAARSLLQAKKLAEEIKLEEYKVAYSLHEDKVRYNLYIALSMPGQSAGQGSPLPAHFFFGLTDWEKDWEAKKDLDEVAKKASSRIVVNSYSLGTIPQVPPYYPLSEHSVIAIFDFLDYPKDYEEILDKVKGWNIYWADVSGIKSGAAQYIHHRNTKSAFDGKLFDLKSRDDEK